MPPYATRGQEAEATDATLHRLCVEAGIAQAVHAERLQQQAAAALATKEVAGEVTGGGRAVVGSGGGGGRGGGGERRFAARLHAAMASSLATFERRSLSRQALYT